MTEQLIPVMIPPDRLAVSALGGYILMLDAREILGLLTVSIAFRQANELVAGEVDHFVDADRQRRRRSGQRG